MTLCGYKRHRESDWMLEDGTGPVTCGICHPPADKSRVVWRTAARWNRAVKAYEARVVEEVRRARDPFDVYDEAVPLAEPEAEPIKKVGS